MTYANIILPLPLDGLFTYTIPEALAPKVQIGVRVIVPLGKSKRYVGIVAEYPITPPAAEKRIGNGEKKIVYKDILEVLDATPGASSTAAETLVLDCRLLYVTYRGCL